MNANVKNRECDLMKKRRDMKSAFGWMCALIFATGCAVSKPAGGNGDLVSELDDDSRVVPFEEPAPVATVSRALTEEDARLLRAAETGDPEVIAAAIAAMATPGVTAACHGVVSSPGPSSCAEWSGLVECGDRQCNASCGVCLPRGDPNCEFPIASTQPTERFRRCTPIMGDDFLEWGPGPSTGSKCRDPICREL
jgi:hypothetical protein